eukprot:3914407-Pyramimonas_sp.AAC.1
MWCKLGGALPVRSKLLGASSIYACTVYSVSYIMQSNVAQANYVVQAVNYAVYTVKYAASMCAKLRALNYAA